MAKVKSRSFNFHVVESTHKNHGKIMEELTDYLNKTKYGYWDGYGGTMGGGNGFDQFAFVKADKYKFVVKKFKSVIKKYRASKNYKMWKENPDITMIGSSNFDGKSVFFS